MPVERTVGRVPISGRAFDQVERTVMVEISGRQDSAEPVLDVRRRIQGPLARGAEPGLPAERDFDDPGITIVVRVGRERQIGEAVRVEVTGGQCRSNRVGGTWDPSRVRSAASPGNC